jgi:hypothetical protein
MLDNKNDIKTQITVFSIVSLLGVIGLSIGWNLYMYFLKFLLENKVWELFN